MSETAAVRNRETRSRGTLLHVPAGRWGAVASVPGVPRREVRMTGDQVLRLPEFALEWSRIGLSTAPADRPRAERAIRTMYRLVGLPDPERIVWCGSPLAMGLARAVAAGEFKRSHARCAPPAVLAALRATAAGGAGLDPGEPVAHLVRRTVLEEVAVAVDASIDPRAAARITRVLRREVERRVEVAVAFPLEDALQAALGAPLEGVVYGQHEAGLLGYYAFLFALTPLRRETARLRGLWELARSASWAAPHERICWVSERPSLLSRDGNGRLHGTKGPAIGFPDGWTLHAQAGVLARS